MNNTPYDVIPRRSDAPQPGGWRGVLRGIEDSFLVLPLIALMALPLIEMVLRRFHTGISGSSTFVQHFTLIVGMIGGAIAAREGRLLAFSTLSTFLKGKLKSIALIISTGAGAAISALLCVASVQFVLTEKSAGGRLAYGIPLWVIELVLPLGFGLVALRLVWHSAPKWTERLLTLSLATLIVVLGVWSPIPPENLLVPALIALVIAIFLGAGLYRYRRSGAHFVLGRSFKYRGDSAQTLFASHQSISADHPLVHTRRLFPCRKRRLRPIGCAL